MYFLEKWILLHIMLLSGVSSIPQLLSCRLICLSFFTWTMLMYQFYSASIVVSLIAEPPRFINTAYDVADSNLEFGFEDIGYMFDFFLVSIVHKYNFLDS